MKGIKIPSVVQKLRTFYWDGTCPLVELHREGSAPAAACAAGLFYLETHIFDTAGVARAFLQTAFILTF